MNWEEKLSEFDALIRAGKGSQVHNETKSIKFSTCPREFIPRFSSILRRSGQVDLSLTLLHPYVRTTLYRQVKPTSEELMEYAASLHRIGSNHEAIEILQDVDSDTFPQALLYESFARIGIWNYEGAIPLLSRYVTRVDGYPSLVGKVNLLAALLYERKIHLAHTLAEEILKTCSAPTHDFVRGKTLQLLGAGCVQQGQYEAASSNLLKAHDLLKHSGGVEEFFVRKWMAFNELAQRKSETSMHKWLEIKKEAKRIHQWESVRDCDRFRAHLEDDKNAFRHLWFGSPHVSFRKWLSIDFEKYAKDLGTSYDWQFLNKAGPVLELDTVAHAKSLRSDSLVGVRLLVALSKDFYRPLSLGEFHFEVYPGEYFNPSSSPERIQVATQRLRSWLKENKYDLTIQRADNFFSLIANTPTTLRIPKQAIELHRPVDLILSKLRSKFGNSDFSVSEAAQQLSQSSRTTVRILNELRSNGYLTRKGASRNTRYQLTLQEQRAA